jgi:serine protease AprX
MIVKDAKAPFRILFALAAFYALSPGSAHAESGKVSADLKNMPSQSTVDVIVGFNNVPGEGDYNKLALSGGSLKMKLDVVKSAAYRVPASALDEIANNPAVARIVRDRKVHSKLDYTAAAINAQVAWQAKWTGSGIGVAVIDSGMAKSPDFDGRIVYVEDFTGGDGNDRYGHGQHIGGVIGASGQTSSCKTCTRTFKGIAPRADLINLRVLDANGEGNDSDVIAAIMRAIQLKKRFNIRVMNLSLGRPVFESYKDDPLCQAVEAAWRAGIVVVVAAGNDGRDDSMGTNGYGTIASPGNDPYVITVGAMKTMGTYDRGDDRIASYSSKGPTMVDHVVKPDILAPGNRVVSLLAPQASLDEAYPQNDVLLSYYLSPSPSGYSHQFFSLNGTSMAAAVVSGAVADLLQSEPALTPDQVKATLMKTAYKSFPSYSVVTDPGTNVSYTSQYDIFTVGAGYLDLAAALANTEAVSGTALSPTVRFDAVSRKIYLNSSPSAVWETQSVWGVQSVWGTSVVDAMQSVWGTNSVWGTSSTTGFQSVWGTNSVWGTSSGASSEATKISIAGEN